MSLTQKSCGSGLKGCKDQVIIDYIIDKHSKMKKKPKRKMYVEYKKTSDSVPQLPD